MIPIQCKISPSILAADFTQLGKELDRVNNADLIHIDVMDGHFVPNISYGVPIARAVKAATDVPLDIHLMIDEPERFIHDFAVLKPEFITIHYEAVTHLQRAAAYIREQGVKVGVALNPHTPLDGLQYVLDDIDMILIMTVNPGYGGQGFIPAMENKIRDCRHMIREYPIDIQVDGGITKENIARLWRAGANIFVAGSAIFQSENPAEYIEEMRLSKG